jgi:hypothetical protein
MQGEMPCAWALVDPEQPKVRRRFWVVGTGHPFPNWWGQLYVGTVQMREGALVFHVFCEQTDY